VFVRLSDKFVEVYIMDKEEECQRIRTIGDFLDVEILELCETDLKDVRGV
jgi:hypothetical protein